MSTQQEGDQTAVSREDSKLSSQEEDTAGETARRHVVDALLDISEDNFRKEQEPFEYHDYSGWEEAVSGWFRAAPLSCILQSHRKLKHKEADHPTLLSVNPTPSKADISASTLELHGKSHIDLADYDKSAPNKQIDSLDPTEWCPTPRDTTEFLFKDRVEWPFGDKPVWPYHFSSQYTENRCTMPQKPSHKPQNKLVPIKNIVFPPLVPPQIIPKVSCHFCRCRKAQYDKNHGENVFMPDKSSGPRGTGVDSVTHINVPVSSAALTSKSHSWQHNPQMFSTLNVSNPMRNQLLNRPKPETVHPTSYSVDKKISQAVVQPHMPPRYLLF